MLSRRRFLCASAALPLAATLHPSTALAFPYVLILQAAAMVASYIGSQGDPTGATANATFQALQALSLNVAALSTGLQHVIEEVTAIRKGLSQVPKQAARESIHYDLFGIWDTIIDLREAEAKDAAMGHTLDPAKRYGDILAEYRKWVELRNSYLAVGADTAFENALHVCLAHSFEAEICAYLIERGRTLDPGSLSVADLIQAESRYLAYFAAAQSYQDEVSLVSLLDAQSKVLVRQEAQTVYEPYTLEQLMKEGDVGVGCRNVRIAAAPRILVSYYYRRIVAHVKMVDADAGLKFFQATQTELPTDSAVTTALGKPMPATPVPDACLLTGGGLVTRVDQARINDARAKMSPDEAAAAAAWPIANWNTYFMNQDFAALYVNVARYWGLKRTIEAVQISQRQAQCKMKILEAGDATCLMTPAP